MAGVLLVLACAPHPDTPVIYEPSRNLDVRIGDSLPLSAVSSDPGPVTFLYAGRRIEGVSVVVDREGTDTLAAVDAGGKRVEWRIVNGVAVPRPGNYALRFFGTGANDVDRVKIRVDDPAQPGRRRAADIGAGDFTIEFWVRAREGDNRQAAVQCGANVAWIGGNILLDRDRYNAGRKFGLSIAGGYPVFGMTGADTEHRTICSDRRVDDGAWHHVAVTRALSGVLRLYVDGQLAASAGDAPTTDISYPDGATPGNYCGGPCIRSDPFLVLGAEKHDVGPDYPAFVGDLDELRLSTVVRYDSSFTLPDQAFRVDPATAALYHFDEGAGDLARDAAGGVRGSGAFLQRGGPAMGPKWISSDAPTGSGAP